jgi:hypothetical protein
MKIKVTLPANIVGILQCIREPRRITGLIMTGVGLERFRASVTAERNCFTAESGEARLYT